MVSYFEDEQVETSFSHGDFTSWNIYKSHKKAGVYDWELATDKHPIGFDAFHFLFQQHILINRSPWLTIREDIYDRIQEKNIQKWSKNNEISINKYLSLYLLTNTTHYLGIYSKQEKWHEQIHWLIETWNQGLSDILKMTKTNRELLILDLFDFLKTKQYGALKFPEISPEKLSEFSDIDLCILKSDYNSIIHFIENHPLISDYTTSSKSYMSSLNIQLIDGGNLSLDLIWNFKRTKWVFLNADELLKRCHPNQYGVKIPSNEKLARYIGLFYGLNGAAVPEKYAHFQEYLTHSPIDLEIKRHFIGEKNAIEKLYQIIKTRKENKGFHKFWNLAQYAFDTAKQMMKNKGIILTFSGVDGAGKSTIIEHVKGILEKKFRKRVVVIRHRPSILPILSAITKGKEQAEKDAASTLPRQGTNQSKLSSFVRFMYYYVDYLFGQIYINFKYKFRGYVVLYDRYYYDFILDSKRSNILINPSIVRFGYKFVFTPDLNFFLYADPEVILKRKQELSAETIVELTKQYKQLFSGYENRKLNKNYHCINNVDLQETLDYITLEINRKLK
jgi:thymidylate kinase